MTIKNPFQKEENLQPWFENFAAYKKSFQASKYTYIQKVKTSNQPTNHIQIMLKYFSTHFVAASFLVIMLTGSVSVVAAEITLPQDYKPSTVIKNLFAANEQPDIDPYTRLVFDGENDVVSLDRCDLAVKYPKKSGENNVEASGEQFKNTFFVGDRLMDPFYNNLTANLKIGLSDDKYSYNYIEYLQRTIEDVEIECFQKLIPDIKALTDTYGLALNTDRYVDTLNIDYTPEAITTNYTTDQLREKYGWFVTQSELTDIKEVSYTRQIPMYDDIIFNGSQEYDRSGYSYKFVEPIQTADYTYHNITFGYNGSWYLIKFYTNSPYTKMQGLKPNQIQMQFNSLVQNESNIVLDNPNQSEVEFTNNDDFDISSNLSCNLMPITSYFGDNNQAVVTSVTAEIAPENRKLMNYFNQFLNKYLSLETEDDTLFFDLNETQYILNNACGGGYKFNIADLDIEYPKTNQSRTVYAFVGNGLTPNISVFVYARAGDDIILLESFIYDQDPKAEESVLYEGLYQECGFLSPENDQCYLDYVKNSKQFQSLILSRANLLI